MRKESLGMAAVITGIVGAGFGVGGVENSLDTMDLLASLGLAAASLVLVYVGTLLVREEF